MSRRHSRRRASAVLGLVAALALALTVTGCGSKSATRAQVITRADAICFHTQQSIRSTAAPAGGLSPSDLPAMAAYLDKITPLLRKQASQLRALPRPAARQATLEAFVNAATRTATDYTQLQAAAKSGDSAGVNHALGDLAQIPVSRLAAAYGLTECTGTAGTTS